MKQWLESKGGVDDLSTFVNRFRGIKKCQLVDHFEFHSRGTKGWHISVRGVQPPFTEDVIRTGDRSDGGGKAPEVASDSEDKAPDQNLDDVFSEAEEEEWMKEDAEEEWSAEADAGGDVQADGVTAATDEFVDRFEDLPEQEAEPEESKEEPKDALEPSPFLRLFGKLASWDSRTGSGVVRSDGCDDMPLTRSALPLELRCRSAQQLEGCELTFELDIDADGKRQARDAHFLVRSDGKGGWVLRR